MHVGRPSRGERGRKGGRGRGRERTVVEAEAEAEETEAVVVEIEGVEMEDFSIKMG